MANSLRRRGGLVLLLAALVLSVPPATAASIKKEMGYAANLAKKGLWNEAAHRFRLLLVREPNHPRLWNDLAVAYEAVGRYEDAQEAYAKAISLAASPSDEMLANQEAFEAFYEAWKAQTQTAADPTEEAVDNDAVNGGETDAVTEDESP